jgi:hypothetical protein
LAFVVQLQARVGRACGRVGRRLLSEASSNWLLLQLLLLLLFGCRHVLIVRTVVWAGGGFF